MKPVWNLVYLLRRLPWDTGITPPEVAEVIERGQIASGYALDIGCGTGTNAIYLAKHGYKTIGIDVAYLAILQARYKSKRQGVSVKFYTGDVLKLGTPKWPLMFPPVDFTLDIGCLHSLATAQTQSYINMLRRVIRIGGHYLLYAWGKREWQGNYIGLEPADVQTNFGRYFQIIWNRQGEEQGLPSYWYFFRRSS